MHCDYEGCKKPSFAEVYPMNGSWSYLCKKHYKQEFKKYGTKYGWYKLSIGEQIKVALGIY